MKTWESSKGVINFDNLNPIELPKGYTFENIYNNFDIIISFIDDNYFTNNLDNSYKLCYTGDHYKWYFNDSLYNFIVLKHHNNIIGCISGKEEYIYINHKLNKVFEINFLCLDVLYRKQNFINYLIAEIGRLSLLKGIKIGIYISQNNHLNQLVSVNYFLYYSNPLYLYKLNYIDIPKYIVNKDKYLMSLKLNNKKNKDEKLSIHKNLPVNDYILKKLNKKYSTYKLSKHFNNNDYSFFNKFNSIITTYTFKLCSNVVGFISYYHLNIKNKDINNGNINYIKQAYILYYWYDVNIISRDIIFNETFNIIDTDIILTNDIDEMSCPWLRNNLKINHKTTNNTFYYLYNYNENITCSSKDIGLFIP